jgi:hypothetical protein
MRSPLDGPMPALPRPLDRLADRWARVPPRTRLALGVLVVVLASWSHAARLDAAQARWGGPGDRVWRAVTTIPAGRDPARSLEPVRLPDAALPAGAVTGPVPRGAVLAITLVEGAVLTRTHLSPAGPAAGLAPDERLLPVPVEASWGIQAGALVDVWAAADDRGDPRPIASARPVVAVREDRGRVVALVSLPADDVAAATAGLSRGGVLLTSRGG